MMLVQEAEFFIRSKTKTFATKSANIGNRAASAQRALQRGFLFHFRYCAELGYVEVHGNLRHHAVSPSHP